MFIDNVNTLGNGGFAMKAKWTRKNTGLYLFCVASFHLCLQDNPNNNQHVPEMRIIESILNSHRLRITFVAAAFCFPIYMLETRSESAIPPNNNNSGTYSTFGVIGIWYLHASTYLLNNIIMTSSK